MATYRFNTTLTVYGYVQREIGDEDPEEYAQQLEEEGVTDRDFTYIRDSEVKVEDWDNE